MDRKKLEQLIFDTCSVEPDYPWMDTPESAVFRHPGNRKWFALVTTVSRSKLGLPGQQPVDIVNLKCGSRQRWTAVHRMTRSGCCWK